MIGSSEIIQENALEHKKKKPVLSANQASNNWALGVMCKVSNRKTLSGETFCFIEKHLLSVFKFVLRASCFITSSWLADNQLSWNILLFSCNLIGQLCLSGPGYSSHTVTVLPFLYTSQHKKTGTMGLHVLTSTSRILRPPSSVLSAFLIHSCISSRDSNSTVLRENNEEYYAINVISS